MSATALVGQAIALAAAFLWAAAVMIFRQPVEQYGAWVINLAKCLLATVLLALTMVVAGSSHTLLEAPAGALGLLAASGLVGMILGDTALFAALGRIGVHRSMLLQTLSPVFTALIAAATTGERLTGRQLLGGALVLLGVALVVKPPRTAAALVPQPASVVLVGFFLAVVSAFGQGSGVVLAKAGMAQVPILPATVFRLAAACAGLFLVVAVRGGVGRFTESLRDRQTLKRVVPATFIGTYLAMLGMMAGIALAPAAIAAVLLSTTPVFSLILEAAADKRWPTLAGIGGTLVSIAGVAVLVSTG